MYVPNATEALVIIASAWLFYKLAPRFFTSTSGTVTTALNGPPNKSFLFGLRRYLSEVEDIGAVLEGWATEYGPAYRLPSGMGSSRIILCDPKANAHFYAKETYGYVQTKLAKIFLENLFGRGLLWAEGDSHKRQRKALSPAFSNSAIRRLTAVFYDSVYKMKATWDSTILAQADHCALIDVQQWMNFISLDSIGIAGFGHDFGALDGKHSPIVDAFESFGSSTEKSMIGNIIFLLGPIFPLLQNLPTKRNLIFRKLHSTMSEIANELLARNERDKAVQSFGDKTEDKSMMGALLKAELSDNSLQMTHEEVLAQKVLLVAGYETTSISLTWSLIELARKPEKQRRLREELAQFAGVDPSWDQLTSDLPYLDAIVHEVLRLHPPVLETTRKAAEDDVIPFSNPIVTKSGERLSHLIVTKGTTVTSPIVAINRSEAFWGPDAKEFRPERWFEENKGLAKDISGHRHLLSFSDGPRICLGRGFALAEFKAVLSVLIRNYMFELPDGPSTQIEIHRSILPRPKLVGQDGPVLYMKVRPV